MSLSHSCFAGGRSCGSRLAARLTQTSPEPWRWVCGSWCCRSPMQPIHGRLSRLYLHRPSQPMRYNSLHRPGMAAFSSARSRALCGYEAMSAKQYSTRPATKKFLSPSRRGVSQNSQTARSGSATRKGLFGSSRESLRISCRACRLRRWWKESPVSYGRLGKMEMAPTRGSTGGKGRSGSGCPAAKKCLSRIWCAQLTATSGQLWRGMVSSRSIRQPIFRPQFTTCKGSPSRSSIQINPPRSRRIKKRVPPFGLARGEGAWPCGMARRGTTTLKNKRHQQCFRLPAMRPVDSG